MTLELEDDDEIEYGDVNFSPKAILTFERLLADEVVARIDTEKWYHFYLDHNKQRRFTITLALGSQLEFRVSVGTTLNIIIRGTSVLPGGQIPLNSPPMIDTIINILKKFHDRLLTNSLISERDLVRWRADHRKWARTTFTYDIPENHLFQIPKNDCAILTYDQTLRLVVQDKITKAVVEVEGRNEDSNLLYQRAAAKLYILRELREL